MRKRNVEFTIYLTLSILAGLMVLIFQSFRWSYGHLVYNTTDHAWDAQIKSAELTCSIINFIFASLTFIHKSRRRLKDKDNFLYLVLLFMFLSDLFFLVADFNNTIIRDVNEVLGGYICFLIAYAIIVVFLKPRFYEIIIRVVLAAALPFVYYLIFKKFDAMKIVELEVIVEVIINAVFSFIKYKKEQSRFSFYIFISMVLAFTFLTFAALRTITNGSMTISNLFAIFVWPLYIAELAVLNHLYRKY